MSALQHLARRPAFPELVRRTRLRAGLTQQQLADLSALSVRAVRDLEAGRVRRPRRDTVRLLADALRLDPTGQSEFLAAATGNAALSSDEDARQRAALFGREAELAILQDLLLAGDQRLISVVGLPGVGKSRLVDEVGHRASLLGWPVVREPVVQKSGSPGRLLILDPVTPVVGELAELHRRDPALRILLCAAAPLGLPGERVLPLAGLPLPTLESGQPALSPGQPALEPDQPALESGQSALEPVSPDQPAIALFVSHARRTRPDRVLDDAALSAIAELCRLLDGVPAAIGNAADWSLVLSWQQLLATARQDPLGIAEPPSAAAGSGWRDGVLAAVRQLRPEQAALLGELAGSGRAWTLEALCRDTGRPPVELAKVLHALTIPGLLRTTRTPVGPSFAVPHLIRRVLLPG